MREGLDSPHLDSRRAGTLALDLHRALNDPRLQARVSDLEFAHAVLVLAADPIEDAPILDLRLRKGVRRQRRAPASGERGGPARAACGELAAAAARRRRGDRDPVARAPHGRPRGRGVRARRCSSWRTRCRSPRSPGAGLLEIPAHTQRPRTARGGRAAERRSRPRRAHRDERSDEPLDARGIAHGTGRGRAGGGAAAAVRPAQPRSSDAAPRDRPTPPGSRARAVAAGARARLDGRRARHVPDRRPARARERRVPRAGLRREGGHDRPPRRAHPAAAPGGGTSPGATRARSGW